MKVRKKYILIPSFVFTLAYFVTCIAAPSVPEKDEFVNLRVLPKDISPKKLQSIMVDEFQDGLGVGCGFCHTTREGSLLLDYASDEKPEKQIARSMMRMTMEINKNYFEVKDPIIGQDQLIISCISCHKGVAHPEKF